jgi:hypothetical protein
MQQLLVSIIVAIVAVPAIASRDPDPVRGLRRMLFALTAYAIVYVAWVTLGHATWAVPPV